MSGRFDLDAALRPALRDMDGYEPIEPPEEAAARYGVAPGDVVKLDGNENPYGPSPRARKALAGGYEAHRYPDPDQRRLRAALAATHQSRRRASSREQGPTNSSTSCSASSSTPATAS